MRLLVWTFEISVICLLDKAEDILKREESQIEYVNVIFFTGNLNLKSINQEYIADSSLGVMVTKFFQMIAEQT